MEFNDIFEKKMRFREILKKSWPLYTQNLKSIALITIIILLPFNLIAFFISLAVPAGSYPILAGICISLSFYFSFGIIADLSVVDLLHRNIIKQPVSIRSAILNGFKSWIKFLLTGLPALLVLYVSGIPFFVIQFITTRYTNPVNMNIFLTLFIFVITLCAVIPFFYTLIILFFFPYVSVIRNKWWVSGLKYCWQIGKGYARRTVVFLLLVAVLQVIIIALMIFPSYFASGLMIVFMMLMEIASMYLRVALLAYYLNLEKLKELSLSD